MSEDVVRYYDQTWADYRVIWLSRANYALHFGYHDRPGMPHEQALVRNNEVLADIARIGEGDHVLDAGCGVGGSSCWLAQERKAMVTGITLARNQVARAHVIAQRRGVTERTRFEVADYSRMPYPDGSFDVVWAQESLCHSPDKAATYREFLRVLRPGGRLVIAEYMRTTRDLTPRDTRTMRAWLDGWKMPDLDTFDEHRAAAVACGFDQVAIRDSTVHVRPSLRRLFLRSVILYPIAILLHLLRIRSATQHGNVRASVLQYLALRRGNWGYGVLSATKRC
jgi:cyclopropane fatty-acyl-phospholipid synthase-like methyltransferase